MKFSQSYNLCHITAITPSGLIVCRKTFTSSEKINKSAFSVERIRLVELRFESNYLWLSKSIIPQSYPSQNQVCSTQTGKIAQNSC